MIFLKSEEEILLIKESAQVLGKAHAEVAKWIKPGITTNKLDKVAEEYIRDYQGIPSFKGYTTSSGKFPSSLCISLNDTVVHGFPSGYQLQEGDVLSIDCGVKLNGFHSDSAYTYPVGEVRAETMALLKHTKQSLYLGIEQAIVGKRVGDIGYAIQNYVERFKYGVVRELVGHGVGRELHESPEVPNYGKRGQGPALKEGMVLAIEPMITLGKKDVVQEKDGWTIRTSDRKPAAHFEHTVVVRKGKAEILTTFKYIEEVIQHTTLMVSV
ncbi:MAG: type I methionyl aminopeptidase [Runella slithyformis]|nr:MAG: type I methionyl aminopeptidase [Runella slithyformis]TAF98193.1 MAG: type I methionyl aminopeptidase [Runella sp.]TAG22640.1 MAG: type I methionyl aminopeptidase [Cytophagales bacterium]TAG41727.1 MAG: type I methionyl aminopeptidase [Cytophagia bacterium]TAF03188.1 MAG: type I methionyl aminopeptidase [Runella slithyformis]